MLDDLLPEPEQPELTKMDMRNLLENIHDEMGAFDNEQLENIEDILENLGITEGETYTRKDVERVYKEMQFAVTE